MVSPSPSRNTSKTISSAIAAALIVAIVIVMILFIYRLIPMLEEHPEIAYWFKFFGIVFLSFGSIAFAVLLVIGMAVAFRLIESTSIKVNFLLYTLWSIPAGIFLLILSKYLPASLPLA